MAKKESGTKPKLATKNAPSESPALNELFKDGIADLYWAENHLVKSLPKMLTAATSADLKTAIESHLAETKEQVARLEQVFSILDEPAVAKKCDAMEGLTKEAEGIVEETEPGSATRDIGIVLASQKIEHYEIASYTGLVRIASTLGLKDVSDLLTLTLNEEKGADEKLTQVAINTLEAQAAQEA
ncbi:ferritin-like domain-containing protein [Pedobacter sp. AW1-32]|uniref:YciE/YciF ferroxidase family protein n=1 Tax=Pedobacter sp. AW1-32 TaxID=3383026 RepID=UPI003FEE5FBA